MSSIYKTYRNRLIEISGKSRSLYSKNTSSKKQAYNLGRLFCSSETEALRFTEFLNSGSRRRLTLLTDTQISALLRGKDIKDTKDAAKEKRKLIESELSGLKALKREIESIEHETGRYELFVGYPFAEGGIGGGVLVKAPLLLYPARIILESNGAAEIEIIRDEPVMLNKVLLLAYAKENRCNIEELNMEFEPSAADLGDINKLKDYLKKFDINLKYPKQSAVIDIETAPELKNNDALQIRNFAVLGRFPLANSIYYDYIQMEKKKLSSPALDAILNNKEPKFKDKKAENFYPIRQPDYAQEMSLQYINKYNNAVIYGPPGTGKSQTITNIISDAMCKGKRVLVVSQKRTALDVVYNRLGSLSGKAMILPDPEKNKSEFYDRAKTRYAEALEYKSSFDPQKLEAVEKAYSAELSDLKLISDTLYTKTSFGLSLQEMYLNSSRLGKNQFDYRIYSAMQNSPIIKMNYGQLNAALSDIKEKNKGEFYYNHYQLLKENPVIVYIKTGLNLDQINRIKTYVKELLSGKSLPFNFAKNPYSRFLMAYNLENRTQKGIRPLSEMIVKMENPALIKKLKVSALFPLFWPAYPYFKSKVRKLRNRTEEKISETQLSLKDYISEFRLLGEVLLPDGANMVIDGISHGNTAFLQKFSAALDDYLKLKDIIYTLKNLDGVQSMLLDFAFNNTDGKSEFLAVLDSIMSIRIYHELIKEEKNKEPVLSKLITFEDIQNKIASLNRQRLQLVRELAEDSFNESFKNKIRQNHEENKNFLHQINKQNKLWPVRRVFQHFEQILFDLFPCWLLSPEAVSAILPLKPDLFDLVIFDEASQIFIESTIPSIYRGRHLVVAGDGKQLRPTSVFIKRYMGDDTYSPELALNTQAVLEVESLLDLATSRLKEAHLTYHYRSRFEELINFSNYAFYNGRLQVAPNNSRYLGYLPIERIKVDGRWIDRKNAVEARAVAELVAKILKRRKNGETLGIVTFNTEQEECIEDTLDALCAADAEFKSLYLMELNRREDGEYKGIFVKNLENVQGDERDIMIFSTAYAKNEDGRVNAQFGTLSLAGGENRLNVAVTRAKEKIYLVTSVEPEEFVTIETSKNLGPKLFKKYLQYARAVSKRNFEETRTILQSLLPVKAEKRQAGGIGGLEQKLKDELEKIGYQVDINLGNTEYKLSLAVYDKGLDRYVLGLECDYTAYGSSDSVAERDVYRSSFLQSRGWKIVRVWSRDWWLNSGALIKNIKLLIEKQKEILKNSLNPVKEALNQPATKTAVSAAKPVKKFSSANGERAVSQGLPQTQKSAAKPAVKPAGLKTVNGGVKKDSKLQKGKTKKTG